MKLSDKLYKRKTGPIGDFIWRGFHSILLLIILAGQLWLNNTYVQINDMNTYKQQTDERFKAMEKFSSEVSKLLAVSEYRVRELEKRSEKLELKVFSQ